MSLSCIFQQQPRGIVDDNGPLWNPTASFAQDYLLRPPLRPPRLCSYHVKSPLLAACEAIDHRD